nr:MAG TPA: hypothetical protein [Caudoviricetes sp.]
MRAKVQKRNQIGNKSHKKKRVANAFYALQLVGEGGNPTITSWLIRLT